MNAPAHDKEPLRPGHVLRGSYRINRLLGSGGFAITYLACHIGLDHQVAIKEYLPADAAMRADDGETVLARPGEETAFKAGLAWFTEEARTLATFNHRGIVSVADIFESNGTAYMALEYVEGETLAALLGRVGTIGEAQVRAMVSPILEALGELHRRGILHRDIKPENILIRENGCPVLIDFGNSQRMTRQGDEEHPRMLTPGYGPIEQYMSTAEEGPWTDIYALAATLYRAITGVTPPDAMARVLEDRFIPARKAVVGVYSPKLLSSIDHALSMKPGRRPQSTAELRSLLDAPSEAGQTIIPSDWIEEVPSSPIAPGRRSRAPVLSRVAFAATLLAATLTGAVYLEWSGRREAEAVQIAEQSRRSIERAQRASAQRREVARWERAAEQAARAYAQSKEAEIARRRAIEAARREAQVAERRRAEAARQRRLAEAKRKDERRRAQGRLAERHAGSDRNPLSGLRRLFLGKIPR